MQCKAPVASERPSHVRMVFLYAEVIGYTVGMLKALSSIEATASIDVVYWDRKGINSTGYRLEQSEELRYHPRSQMSESRILQLLQTKQPEIIFVSGWMDDGYIRVLRRYKKLAPAAKVVCGIDDQWENTLRQKLGRIYFRLFYKHLFDFMWVSGKPQYHYAQRMGYGHENIISNLYSADTCVFDRPAKPSRRFVFVGRFDPVKGLDTLLDAYLDLPESSQQDWKLVLIGDGELRGYVEKRKSDNVVTKPFLQPAQLMEELLQGGVACITSHHDQWGVAIHEMALLGFPLVLSSACGAASEFLITGYNGFLFTRGSKDSLKQALLKTMSLHPETLKLFSDRSRRLGLRICPEHTAHSLLSVLELPPAAK